jgi:hypothetical protein
VKSLSSLQMATWVVHAGAGGQFWCDTHTLVANTAFQRASHKRQTERPKVIVRSEDLLVFFQNTGVSRSYGFSKRYGHIRNVNSWLGKGKRAWMKIRQQREVRMCCGRYRSVHSNLSAVHTALDLQSHPMEMCWFAGNMTWIALVQQWLCLLTWYSSRVLD